MQNFDKGQILTIDDRFVKIFPTNVFSHCISYEYYLQFIIALLVKVLRMHHSSNFITLFHCQSYAPYDMLIKFVVYTTIALLKNYILYLPVQF